MTGSLGLSIGMTNLVAAPAGGAPVTRRAVLNLVRGRGPEVGVPAENPNLTEPGLVLSGFVERVGDPVPIIGADGTSHQADRLLVEALDAMVYAASGSTPPSAVTIAVPAHWGPAVLGALRSTLRVKPSLSPGGMPAPLIPDSVAALAALQANHGLPKSGVVALLDFGGSGTSITLADAGQPGLQPIDETLRYTEFSGELIDQALLTHVLADIKEAGGQQGDPAGTGTTAVGALTALREQCRLAKERLSAQTATELTAAVPGFNSNVRITRTELENLIQEPLGGVIAALGQLLERNRVQIANLSAVATVGGGAAIPLITQRLSEQFRVQVITPPQPALVIAAGAAVIAGTGGMEGDVPTGLAPASDVATGLAPAAWAAGAAAGAAGESAADGASSATFRALAWSQEDGTGEEPVPYTGADYSYESYEPPTSSAAARPQFDYLPPDEPPQQQYDAPLPWYKRPQLIFGAAAAVLVLATGGLIVTLTSGSSNLKNDTPTSQAITNPETPGAPLTETVTVTGNNGSETVVTPPRTATTQQTPTTTPTTTTTTSPTTTSSTTSTTSSTTSTTSSTTSTTSSTKTTTPTTKPTTPTTQPPPTTPTTVTPPPTSDDPPPFTPTTYTPPPPADTTGGDTTGGDGS